ncbi:MAG TPA: extracellular solute-binding protein [Oceanobacillus sp.]|nr:extracellular solute-binding protein [Oceanobacillus sp.]
MRKLLLVSLVLALALSAVLVLAQDDLGNIDPSGQTIVYWHQYSDGSAQGDTIALLIDQFNETNEWGITVEGIFQGSYDPISELMNAGIVSGELPNLVAGYANNAASYYRDGAAVDLNPYINDPTWGLTAEQLADLNMALVNFNNVDEAQLAWPNQASAELFVVNLTLLDELGFDGPPETPEEFMEMACASANSTGPNGEDRQGFPIIAGASPFESWVAARGGSIFDGEVFTFAGNTPVEETLQMYKDLYDQGCGYIPAERFAEQTDFNLGLNPFIVTSSAGFTFIIAGFEDTGYEAEWVVAPYPHTTEDPVIQVFVPSIIMVPSTPEAQLASWLFLKFLTTPQSAATWSEGSGYFNPVLSTSTTMREANFSEGLYPYFSVANGLVNNPDNTLYSSPNIAAYSVVRGLIGEAIANVTSNGMSVEEAITILQEGADRALEESM